MDIAKHLTAIDLLCVKEFYAEEAGSDLCTAGPGYFSAELETSHGLRAASAWIRERTEADFHAHREAIAERLNDRWGGQPPWGQQTVRVRMGRGEVIPEPWATLSLCTDELEVWRVEGAGRWVALGVADRDKRDEVRLLATVTDIDPP